MTSFSVPINSAHAQSSLGPMSQEVYCSGEDGERQVVLLLAVPTSCTDERTTTPPERRAGMSLSQFAEDLTTRPSRCDDYELHANEGLSRGRTSSDVDGAEKSAVVTAQLSARNPVFGTSKSPKSYWLRRHSDSVFTGADRDLPQRDDEPASSGYIKERTVSDSRSTVKEIDVCESAALADNCMPLAHRFQTVVVGMRYSGDSDDVFDEAPVVQSTCSRKDLDPDVQHFEEPAANYPQLVQCTVHSHRARSTVASIGDLDNIDEENQSSRLSEHANDSREDSSGVVDASMFAKLEVNEVSEQPLSDSVRSLELSGNSLWQYSEDDDENHELASREGELARREAANARAVVRRRTSRVERSARTSATVESTSGCEATVGGGKIHRCSVCRRTFSRSDMLERHARLHTGVRPYACRLCTQVFSRSDHLTTHLRTHTGEKPYACPRCAYTASRRDMVTRHLRVHQSTPAHDAVTVPVSAMVGPARRRIYRSRYKERATRRPAVDGTVPPRISPPEPPPASLDKEARYAGSVGIDRCRLNAAVLSWPGTQQRDAVAITFSSPSPPASETASRRRLEHLQALRALSRSVVARGSTGSTDSYSSPGCLSGNDVFEFAVGGGAVEGSPDVFRSPSAVARQSTVFLFPYAAASAALSVCDPTDSF